MSGNEPETSRRRGGAVIRVALWVAQVALATSFLLAAQMKLSMPAADLTGTGIPVGLTRFIGVVELLGAVGLILPAITRVYPMLTVLAAGGLTTVMVLASGFHLARGEYSSLVVTIALGLMAVFVAWGRVRAAPIEARHRDSRGRQREIATSGVRG